MREAMQAFARRACVLPDKTGRLYEKLHGIKARPLRIAAFGGSVTYGFSPDGDISPYPVRLCRKLGRSTVLRNFAAAGTNAWFGLYLAAREAEQFAPDIVIIEYAVNQEANAEMAGAFESLCCRLLSLRSSPAVAAVMCTNEQRFSSEKLLTQIAAHYGLPVISVSEGLHGIPWETYAGDCVHPNSTGQEMIAEALYQTFLSALPAENAPMPETACLTREPAKLRICRLAEGTGGLRERIRFLDCFDHEEAVILTQDAGTFTVGAEGAAFLILFRQSCYADTENAALTVDGGPPVTLYASCSGGWGNPAVQRVIPKQHLLKHTLQFQVERGSGRFILWAIAAY